MFPPIQVMIQTPKKLIDPFQVTQIREAVVVQLGDVSCETELPRTVVFLRQGSMVSVGCSASECWQLRTKLLMSLGRESTSSWAEAWTVLELRQAPGLADVNKAFHMHRDGTLSLQTASPEVLAVVAHVLGTSECLQHFERLIDGTLTRIDHVNQEVLNTGAISGTKHDLMRLLAQVDMDLSRLIRETPRMPRVVWEHSELEELWDQLREEYDVVDRFERLQVRCFTEANMYFMFITFVDRIEQGRQGKRFPPVFGGMHACQQERHTRLVYHCAVVHRDLFVR
ncbi:MAG: hypothetical protein MHM6MM_004940 [Cercozoa sp. M6MM]